MPCRFTPKHKQQLESRLQEILREVVGWRTYAKGETFAGLTGTHMSLENAISRLQDTPVDVDKPPTCGHSACRQYWIDTGVGGNNCQLTP